MRGPGPDGRELAARPGSAVLELDDHGVHRTRWQDLQPVGHRHRYPEHPEACLRHITSRWRRLSEPAAKITPMDPADALAGLDAHPWASVSHAYGPAEDLPDLLRALAEGGGDAEEAISELYSCILHQGTVFPASTDAVPYLARIAAAAAEHGAAEILRLLGGLAESDDEWKIAPDVGSRSGRCSDRASGGRAGWRRPRSVLTPGAVPACRCSRRGTASRGSPGSRSRCPRPGAP
ncbi:hypothetical protein ACH4E7_11480 [Kitasatospora sp. NPDC018058]|uniref:hypothetical protein n=1 Tax=Kitasatospora sp. NPDC018058 TaxID=3364025 RepID=UPI0037BF5FD4